MAKKLIVKNNGKLRMHPIDDMQDQNDNANRCCDCYHRYWADMNSPPVLALVIVDETGRGE